MMEARMVKLEKEITSPDLRIVSVSIDPQNDTPAIMKAYADGIGVDESRSYFLTGSKQAVFETARGLKLGATAAAGGNSITHTQKVLLIDRDNQVRGVYDTNDDDSMKKLADDVKALIAD
jgi:protein SCO1/2